MTEHEGDRVGAVATVTHPGAARPEPYGAVRDLLDQLEGLELLVSHPPDEELADLWCEVGRLGVSITQFWPPDSGLPHAVDVAVCSIVPETRALSARIAEEGRAALICIVDLGDVHWMPLLLEARPVAVITKPVALQAMLTSVVVACQTFGYRRRLRDKAAKLDEVLKAARKVEQAKTILMTRGKIEEPEAYAFLREQAMRKKVTINMVASGVVDADGVLGVGEVIPVIRGS